MQNIQAEHAFPPSWTDKTKPGGGGGRRGKNQISLAQGNKTHCQTEASQSLENLNKKVF